MDILLSEDQIQARISELGRQIEADYQGKALTIVAVLTGSLIVLADLIRRIHLPLRVALLQASSYKGATTSAGALIINEGPPPLAKLFNFFRSDVNELPGGWKAAHTGTGEGSIWKVVADSGPSMSGLVLAQTAESPNAYFNLCVSDKLSVKDLEMSVAFKAIKGKLDRGGGLVWRYQDADNYYIARMNPLEDKFDGWRGRSVVLEDSKGFL